MKKLLAFILGTALILGAVFCCVGCGEDNSTPTQEEQEKGGSEKEDKKDKCADGHTWGEWAQKTAATCVADGVNVRTCSVCGKTEEQTIPKLVKPSDRPNKRTAKEALQDALREVKEEENRESKEESAQTAQEVS